MGIKKSVISLVIILCLVSFLSAESVYQRAEIYCKANNINTSFPVSDTKAVENNRTLYAKIAPNISPSEAEAILRLFSGLYSDSSTTSNAEKAVEYYILSLAYSDSRWQLAGTELQWFVAENNRVKSSAISAFAQLPGNVNSLAALKAEFRLEVQKVLSSVSKRLQTLSLTDTNFLTALENYLYNSNESNFNQLQEKTNNFLATVSASAESTLYYLLYPVSDKIFSQLWSGYLTELGYDKNFDPELRVETETSSDKETSEDISSEQVVVATDSTETNPDALSESEDAEALNLLAEDLFSAILYGNNEIATQLIDQGAPLDKMVYDNSPLNLAVSMDNLVIAKKLLEAGAEINKALVDGANVLTTAAGKNNVEIVSFLIDNSVNLDAQSDSGATALHLAASLGYMEVVEVLIEAGADYSIENNFGFTAADFAANNGYNEIAEYILTQETKE